MSEDNNVAVVRRFIEDFWNTKNFSLADELIHADHTSPSLPMLPTGPEGIKLIGTIVTGIFTGFHRELQDIFATGDKVAARWENSGVHTGTYMNIPGTGKSVRWWELGIFWMQDGKILKSWYRPDEVGLVKELAAEKLEWLHM
jgi:hypothetical protein